MPYITASKLYDYLQCPHRVWRDIYGPQDEKIEETNPFVELLWEKGVQHEEEIIGRIGEFVDLGEGPLDERFNQTLEAMKAGTPLIYQGVLKHENLLGIPDLLSKLPDGTYMPIDIKSGMAFEGGDKETCNEGKPKKHYAVQLCLYNELLKHLGFATHFNGKIIDIQGNEVMYDLKAPMGVRTPMTWWEYYEKIKKHVEFLLSNQDKNKPAMAGVCKMCPWYNSCKKWWEENDDLTRVFYLGRGIRDTINDDLMISKTYELLDVNIEDVMSQKKKDKHFLYGIAEPSLKKMIRRANILVNTEKPVLYEPVDFPVVSYELFFDIENDPTQEFVYLHGVYERTKDGERFLDFTAKELGEEAEKQAWQEFWAYIDSLPENDFAVYYYSHHEKTTYKKMQKQYTDVISEEKLAAFFDNSNVIDLYNIIQKKTDWPLGSYSLKALAVYLGFSWRDDTPSGALSIQWFNDYLEKKDPKILERILLYNEDDCKATMVLKDALEKLQIQTS
ncbi:TM0106 family RecB-like putative nuclease [Pseudomonadota bacterium]